MAKSKETGQSEHKCECAPHVHPSQSCDAAHDNSVCLLQLILGERSTELTTVRPAGKTVHSHLISEATVICCSPRSHKDTSRLYKTQLVHLPDAGFMRCILIHSAKPFTWIRLTLVAISVFVSSGWTCSAIFISCQGVGQPHITALSPDSIPADGESIVLDVLGNDFTSQSQIMWNGNALSTTVADSHHLQTAITQQTFESFGGSSGGSVQISVTNGFGGCPIDGNSSVLLLAIR